VVGTTFVLLRHGETALTAQKRFSGSGGADPGLSAHGRRQAERAASALSATDPRHRPPGKGRGRERSETINGGPPKGRGELRDQPSRTRTRQRGREPERGAGGTPPRPAPADDTQPGPEATVVLTSPLARCRQTAAIVAARLGGLAVQVEDGLRETAFGAWEGLTFAEVQAGQPAELDAWLASTAVPPPGGESFDEVAARVAGTRDDLLARYPGRTLLLVTHVTPAKSLIRLALGAPPEAVYRMELAPASLSAVTYYPDGNCSVRVLNDTGHLR
jgi:ribonuclease H / adenosylcobalamin/alpha-ribazole phosphatase